MTKAKTPPYSSDAPRAPDKQRPVLTLDYALYEQFLADCDLSEEQKREFLDTLWSIIISFVDLGFGVHPAQLATDESPASPNRRADIRPIELSIGGDCGQIRNIAPTEPASVVNCKDTENSGLTDNSVPQTSDGQVTERRPQ